jgi:hypothetical protein
MDTRLEKLTNEEISLAKHYIDKWNKILFSTQSIQKETATLVVNNAYNLLDLPSPNLIFLPSSSIDYSLLTTLNLSEYICPKQWLKEKLLESIWEKSHELYFSRPYGGNKYYIFDRTEQFRCLCRKIYSESILLFDEYQYIFSFKFLDLEFSSSNPWLYDFYINCINIECDLEIWKTWKFLCEECPYLWAFKDTCIIIDRPSELYLDRELLAHTEGKAAIKFIDGYKIYCNHGVTLPVKYGQVHPSNWRAKWILFENELEDNEQLIYTLLINIGYDKFSKELPTQKYKYWENYRILISESIEKIIYWQFFYCDNYYKKDDLPVSHVSLDNTKIFESVKDLSSKISQELDYLCQSYSRKYQLAPGLYFDPSKKAIQNLSTGLDSYPVRLFYGDRQEIYYVICDNQERMISPVYCQFPGEEPVIYAECVTSLIVTIAQCYQEGAYYIAIDEETGDQTIEQDLDKIEPIFEKFNPDQIDTWRKIWKS